MRRRRRAGPPGPPPGVSPQRAWLPCLLEDGDLFGPRAEHRADLGAIGLGLVGLVYRTLGLGKERIESAAEVIEGRPVLVGGDQQDIRVVRSARLHHDY